MTKPYRHEKPRVLFLDIETAPAKGYFWGKTYQTDIIKVLRPSFMLSYAWQWMEDNKIHFKGLPDYKFYKQNLENDFFLTKDLRELMNTADVIIAHNGDRFDIPTIQARMIRYNMQPASPFKTVDTLKAMKFNFKIESNRLNFAAQYLGIGEKLPHTGLDLWERCMSGDTKAWGVMEEYNRHDIYLLKEVYDRIKGYIKNHPDLSAYDFALRTCPTCRSNHVIKRGHGVNRISQYVEYQCRDCGKYFKGENVTRKQAGRAA